MLTYGFNDNHCKRQETNEIPDDFGLICPLFTPLQLESLFFSTRYLELVYEGFWGSKGVNEENVSA